MEDAHTLAQADGIGFFGVYDGHGGDATSRFVADNLPSYMVGNPNYQAGQYLQVQLEVSF